MELRYNPEFSLRAFAFNSYTVLHSVIKETKNFKFSLNHDQMFAMTIPMLLSEQGDGTVSYSNKSLEYATV